MGYTVSMDRLIESYMEKMRTTSLRYIRDIEHQINWDARLIGIRGSRGTGKTTLLLQHIKKTFADDYSKALYASLDHFRFSTNTLLDLADWFKKQGGTHLFLDEVHTYPNWSVHIKNIYDDYPSLHIVFTGSSLLQLIAGGADLSRRALSYTLSGLSFREYLAIEEALAYPTIALTEILFEHRRHTMAIAQDVNVFPHFHQYLQFGYYPFYREGKADYKSRLAETIRYIIERELPFQRNVAPSAVPKIKLLLMIIAESVPFTPNISKLSERIGISRQTLITYLQYLEEAKIISLLYKSTGGISLLQKPEKIYLDNTNLIHLLGEKEPDIGNIRETFLASMLRSKTSIRYTDHGDFLVNNTHTIEAGGKNKTRKQIQTVDDGFIAADMIEHGSDRRVPLWLFGFLH